MESPALVDDRQRWLLARLEVDRRLVTTEAAELLGVSVDTVRRDLRAMHRDGLLRRVHGGAMPTTSLSSSFRGRSDESGPARAALAEAIANRFLDGQVIGLDAGSTNVDVAGRIPPSLAVTVVTNSPAAAVALADHPSSTAILLGGVVDLTWMATTGAEVVDGWRAHHLDVAVLGACGFDPERGASTRSANEVEAKRALVAAGSEVVLPVQRDKLGVLAPFRVAGTDAIDVVVTDGPTDDAVASCRAAGVELLVAGP